MRWASAGEIAAHRKRWEDAGLPFGTCLCGCGALTTSSTKTDRKIGWLKGQPAFYLQGHARRRPQGWMIEDRGYETPCRIWTGALGDGGYGTVSVDGKTYLTHLVAFAEAGRTIPGGWQVDHLCRQRACGNPDHLEAVPPALNTRRGRATKLTQTDVDEIRRSALSHVALASIYGVHASHISRIRSREMWRDLDLAAAA